MEIINLDNRDYHIHSSTFSDGMSTVDEIIRFAGEMGMTEIAITDHSQASINTFINNISVYSNSARWSLKNWQNVHNNVKVIFGVEGDLLDEEGNCCFDIQGYEPEFLILSLHKLVYKGKPENITSSFIKAIEKYHKKIKFIGHPYSKVHYGEYFDIEKIVEIANKYNIPIEFNGKDLYNGNTILEKLDIVLKKANKVYINSDAHNLYEFKILRQIAINYLKEKKFI